MKRIAIGRDMRESGQKLYEAFAKGATEGGADITYVGMVSTDAPCFAVGKYGFDGGVMHGLAQPRRLQRHEVHARGGSGAFLDHGLVALRDRVAAGEMPPPVERPGSITTQNILEDFGKHCVSFIGDLEKIRPFKIAVDAGNGMAGETIPYVFKHLPREVVPLYFELDGSFPNHPASPIEDENKGDLRNAVLEHGCDLGAAFDGDANRCFIVDEKGGFPDGGVITMLCAIATLRRQPGSTILYNLVCSRSVPEQIRKHGGIPVRSPVGHSLIKPIMREQNIPFGGEHSGHFYFRDNWFADSGMIALMQCLEIFSDAAREGKGEINSHVGDIPGKMQQIQDGYKDGEIDHVDGVTVQYPNWWLKRAAVEHGTLLRLNVEGDTQQLMEQHRDEALALIRR
jgi:phosphomannomutase